ncbi:MAG: dihydropteroate synthase [Acidobacteria bacterium]|nr:dihydropteroate synthase [Acidobacteriota bacterium]
MVNTASTPVATTIGRHTFHWGSRTYVMGIVNVTTDSFSGDGLGGDVEAAVAQALAFQEGGADLIDVGGESTRPPGAVYDGGATPVSTEEELGRVIPVIERLNNALDIPISIDTYKAEVARQAVAAGAALINDVWGLQRDPEIATVAAETGTALVLMHNQAGTEYRDLLPDILTSLRKSLGVARDAGVAPEKMIVDPGIGFGKTATHNLQLLARLDEIGRGRPLLVGTSRKSFLGSILDKAGRPSQPTDRDVATAASMSLAISSGAAIVRVHDVGMALEASRTADAIVRAHR